MPDPVSFETFLDEQKWRTFDEHIGIMDDEMEKDLSEVSQQDQVLRERVREMLEREYQVRCITAEAKRWGKETLFSGEVCAVDGTRSIYPLLAGARCRIGVVAVSYRGNRTDSVVFVSEQQVNPPEANPLSILQRRRAERTVISSMVAGAIMAYMERSIALKRPEKWKLLNGPLIPYELRTGLGELRALEPCLELSARIIEEETIAGVSGTSSQPDLTSVGLALSPGEYVRLHSLKEDLTEYLHGSPDDGIGARSAAKFGDRDRRLFEEFIRKYGDGIDVGIFRAGMRPYIFQAHRRQFDQVAALLISDAEMQPMRSYPLLVDYADSLCTKLFAGGDFRRQVEMKLSKVGALENELPEQFFRRR